MLRKLFTGRGEDRTPDRQELERILARLTLEPPHAVWAALIHAHGRPLALIPSQSDLQRDRIMAMGSAVQALGERICKELQNGELRYSLLAGASASTLVVALDREHILTLGLAADATIDTTLQAVREAAIPLMQALGIAALPL